MMRAEGERCLHPELWMSRWHLKGMLSRLPRRSVPVALQQNNVMLFLESHPAAVGLPQAFVCCKEPCQCCSTAVVAPNVSRHPGH